MFEESEHLKNTSYGNMAPQDVIPSNDYSTTAQGYGMHHMAKFGPTMKLRYGQHTVVSRRPSGADIGTSRPWPQMNKALLDPRVPKTWLLEPGQQNQQRPTSSHMLARAQTPEAYHNLNFSSQRDVTAAASMLFAAQQQQRNRSNLKAGPR